jgi:hypothetical protein
LQFATFRHRSGTRKLPTARNQIGGDLRMRQRSKAESILVVHMLSQDLIWPNDRSKKLLGRWSSRARFCGLDVCAARPARGDSYPDLLQQRKHAVSTSAMAGLDPSGRGERSCSSGTRAQSCCCNHGLGNVRDSGGIRPPRCSRSKRERQRLGGSSLRNTSNSVPICRRVVTTYDGNGGARIGLKIIGPRAAGRRWA